MTLEQMQDAEEAEESLAWLIDNGFVHVVVGEDGEERIEFSSNEKQSLLVE